MSPSNGGRTRSGLDPTTIDFIAGTNGGIAGLIVGHPLDTVKTRFQTPEIRAKYRSTFHALATIVREEKVVGLYKGITSPFASSALMNGVLFASYGFFTDLLCNNQSSPSHTRLTLAQLTSAGAAAGIVTAIVTTPVDLIKIRQQNSVVDNLSVRGVIFGIVRRQGLSGLYRGLTVTAIRDISYGAYFGTYEAMRRMFERPSNHSGVTSEANTLETPWWGLLIAGGVAGVVGWSTTFPLDVVKTRVQSTDWHPLPNSAAAITSERMQLLQANHTTLPVRAVHTTSSELQPYRTTWSTIINSYRSEGISVFFRGLAPTIIRAVPVNMATFAFYELTSKTLT